jgi:hypothetical protein
MDLKSNLYTILHKHINTTTKAILRKMIQKKPIPFLASKAG